MSRVTSSCDNAAMCFVRQSASVCESTGKEDAVVEVEPGFVGGRGHGQRAQCLRGGGSDDNPLSSSTALTVTPSLGRILNAAIEARCLATGKVLGSGSTDPSGPITLSGTCSGPVLVELLANGGTQYFDENLGALVALPAGSALRAIVPTFTAGTPLNLAITPLTEIATRQAIAAAGSEAAVTATQALAANTAVVTQILARGSASTS